MQGFVRIQKKEKTVYTGECIFCRIASGKAGTQLLYEDEDAVAFKDINPQAPFHILVIPKKHFENLKAVDDERLIGHLFTVASNVARELGISDFRTVINTGPKSGQTVYHLHIHLLGGRYMMWPPG